MAKHLDLGTITIESVIVHDIPKHKFGDLSIAPNFSEQEGDIPDGLRLFFKDKVVTALTSDKSFRICYEDGHTSPVSWLLGEIIKNNDADYVLMTKGIAKHLFDIQGGVNAAGILVIMKGSASKCPVCMILKLERDKGAQLKRDNKTKSFNIQEVSDLMLTQKTKIFKVALFVDRDDFSCNYDGIVADYQINIGDKREATSYFIDKFLGCRPFEDPKITTQKFYNLTRAYIDTIEDQIVRAKYVQDINSYIQRNSNVLSPEEFADLHLVSTKHKNDYKAFLDSKKFKHASFPKDTQLIHSKIRKIQLVFENGLSILGDKGTLGKKVTLERLDDGQHKAEIISKLKKIV